MISVGFWFWAGLLALLGAFIKAKQVWDKMPDIDIAEAVGTNILFWFGLLALTWSAYQQVLNYMESM